MTPTQAIVTAAVAGLVAAPHCVLMCGPLAVAGCSRDGKPHARDTLGYVVGRSLAYAAVGACLGQLGQHALHVVPIETLQTVAAGALALFCVWRGASLLRRPSSERLVKLRPSLVALPTRGLGLGMITSVLPCGALFAGWVIAAATAHALVGAAVMFSFSIASAPGPLVAVIGHRAIGRRLASWPRVVFACAWFLVALLVLGRIWMAASQGAQHCHG